MTRREKILLQICIVIGIAGVCFVYVLMPSVKKSRSLAQELEMVELEELNIMSTVELTGLEDTLENEKERAEQNYEFFYGKLNSYTIDDILNNLAEQNHLDIQSLSISEYSRREDKEILGEAAKKSTETAAADNVAEVAVGMTEAKEQYLLAAECSLSLIGSYSNVMQFLSDLKRESDCIVVKSTTITYNTRAASLDTTTNANVVVTLYGIDNEFLKSMEEGGDGE